MEQIYLPLSNCEDFTAVTSFLNVLGKLVISALGCNVLCKVFFCHQILLQELTKVFNALNKF